MISTARTRRLAALVATTVLGFSVATAAPALADSRTLKDGRGDTWDVSGTDPVKKSGHPEGDVRKVVIKHGERKLVITVRTQNLKRTGSAVGTNLAIRAAGGNVYDAAVYGEDGAWGGSAYFAGGETDCEATGTMNYKQDLMTFSVPTSCFESPEWVKVNPTGVWISNDDKVFNDAATSNQATGDYTRRINAG